MKFKGDMHNSLKHVITLCYHSYLSILNNLATATLASTPYHIVTKQENLKEEQVKKEMKSQPKHPWCKKVAAKNLKKAVLKNM